MCPLYHLVDDWPLCSPAKTRSRRSARNEDEPFVEWLYRALQARRLDVRWDWVSMASRLLTVHQEIRAAIAARKRLVLVVGARAVTSGARKGSGTYKKDSFRFLT